MSAAPPPAQLPLFPASWYWFGAAHGLARRPVSRDLLGRRLVAYRTASGRAAVLDARCAHLGADLGEGSVIGDDLQCAFHNWRYGPDGRCTLAPAAAEPPAFARQRSYPSDERHGHLFFFNGPRPLFPLPFFAGAEPGEYVAGRFLNFDADCPWHLLNANAFDAQHFRASHDRELVGEPVVDCPHPYARRIRVTFQVAGDSIFDRLLRRFAGKLVNVSMTNWGGTIIVLTADFPRARSTLISYTEPITEIRCIQNVLVYSRRSRFGPLADKTRLFIRRLFTHGFMAGEFDTLAGIRYVPDRLLACDRLMVEFLQWIAGLPQIASADKPDTDSPCLEPVALWKELAS